MTQDRLYIVIPAYNESENITQVVEEWYPHLERIGSDSRLCVFNDGSKDNTAEILAGLADRMPQLEVINKANSGHGATLMTAYHYALEQGADYVFQTDSDGQTLASEFQPFWDERRKQAFYVGLRSKREDGFSRKVVTRILRSVIRLSFGISLPDANTPYRLMERSALAACLESMPKDFFLANVLLLVTACYRGDTVRYREIVFRPRQGGENSINLKRIFGIGRESLRSFREARRELEARYGKPAVRSIHE